jgi:integrating conjugative element protein (TIGR03759 family)
MSALSRRFPPLFVLAVSVVLTASADVSETEVNETETVLTEEALAQQWRLSTDEWKTYKTLTKGPRGTWSPNLDPITVLGIHAETDAERRRYAELLVMVEFERVERELKFQQAYDAAAKRLFPTLSPVQPADTPAVPSLVGVDRIGFVGSIDGERCPTCRNELQKWLRTIRDPSAPALDLFLDDASDDAAIRSWATEQGIDPEDVIAGRITLNHARDPMALPPGKTTVKPALRQRVGGRWLPLDDAK